MPRFALRSVDVGRRLDTFLVCAIAAVLGNRVFLIITGYPQVGSGTLHISHAIWGALMMMIALVAAVSFLAPFTRSFVAVLGGAGFGWFIDELGKFITRDVNYFFKPTFALIYMTFVAMYLVFRALERRRYTADEAALNAIEALKAAQIGQLAEAHRREVLALLDATHASSGLASRVRDLLGDVSCLPEHAPGWASRLARRLRGVYLARTERPSFTLVVSAVFIGLALGSVGDVVWIRLNGAATFARQATLFSACAGALLVLVGVPFLPRHRLEAYRWFDRGLLVTIFVVEIFVFAAEQLAGVVGLAIALVAWALLRSAMRAEREREALSGPAGRTASANSD